MQNLQHNADYKQLLEKIAAFEDAIGNEKERNLKLSGQVTGGEKVQANEFKGADFILTGKFQGISGRGKAGASDYVLYTFQLLNPRTSDIVWEGFHEIKKQGRDDVSYR